MSEASKPYLIAFSLLKGLGNQSKQQIISLLNDHHISVKELFDSFNDTLALISDAYRIDNDTSRQVKNNIRSLDWDRVDQAMKWQEISENHIICLNDKNYPALVKQVASPSLVLYAKGNPEIIHKIQLAMVGSRNPSTSGYKTAYDFAYYLSAHGMIITSGMALGIDAACHQACIDNHKPTIAVTGTGLDRVYPAKHKQLAHQIADTGLLLSEFPLGTPPARSNFPRRNQLISALSVGTLVVEATLKSGSLITAHAAMDQGREVFAIPGSIHSPLSKGCHQLIKSGAKLIEKAEEILEEIAYLSLAQAEISKTVENKDNVSASANENTRLLYNLLDYSPLSIEHLSRLANLDIAIINACLTELELDGLVIIEQDGSIMKAP